MMNCSCFSVWCFLLLFMFTRLFKALPDVNCQVSTAFILFPYAKLFHTTSHRSCRREKKKNNPPQLLWFVIIHLLIITPRQNLAYMWCKPDLGSDLWTTWLSVAPYSSSPSVLPHICPSIIPMASGRALIPPHPIPHSFGQQERRRGWRGGGEGRTWDYFFITFLWNCITVHEHMTPDHAFTY